MNHTEVAFHYLFFHIKSLNQKTQDCPVSPCGNNKKSMRDNNTDDGKTIQLDLKTLTVLSHIFYMSVLFTLRFERRIT